MSARPAAIADPEVKNADPLIWLGWLPLFLFPIITIVLRSKMQPWAFMWLLAFAIYAGCKWQSYWNSRLDFTSTRRAFGYLFFWPGMDPAPFATQDAQQALPALREWLAATGKSVAGFLLIFLVVPQLAFYSPLAAGWVGMIGATLVLHFGTFHLLALGWQIAGIAAQPIMQKPALSESLSEFWGRRWNCLLYTSDAADE